MHVHVLPKEITYRLPHRESDRISSFVRTYVQYTQSQNTLTNSTIGKCHHSSKEPCDLYRRYEWKAPQSAGIPLANCISLTLESRAKAFVLVYFLTFLWHPFDYLER